MRFWKKKKRFGPKRIRWIKWFISMICFFILFNGTQGFFQSFRGLRRCDPLFLYLFILAMETLSCILNRQKEGGFIVGFIVSGRRGVGMDMSPCG